MEESQNRMRLALNYLVFSRLQTVEWTWDNLSREFSPNQEENTTGAFHMDFNLTNHMPWSNLEERYMKNS